MIEKGKLYKHFKGEDITKKNIYRILYTNVIYSGDSNVTDKLIIYQNIKDGKIFAREEKDLLEPLSTENQIKYNQMHRVDELDEAEIKYAINFLKTK